MLEPRPSAVEAPSICCAEVAVPNRKPAGNRAARSCGSTGTIWHVSVEIRRASGRFVERSTGRLSHHGFSFGDHYDPDRVSFGPMVCHDDHLLGRGVGFDEHPHQGLEIVTWVVSGSVEHRDSTGASATLGAGECGLLSAGSGVRHSEVASGDGPARFVQVWLSPETPGREPSYASTPVAAEPAAGLVPVAGPGAPL
ncbi:pirin family protein, partial [Nocardioides sp.]